MLAELAARAGPLFEIRCKSTTKKRSHQILWLRWLTKVNFRVFRCIFGGYQRLFSIAIPYSTQRCRTGYIRRDVFLATSNHDTGLRKHDCVPHVTHTGTVLASLA